MGQALYRKYRSKKLSEVIGQDHITTTLQNALKSGKISHAYLFTGPKGVGKTSVARILAHEINNLPYDGNSAEHIDIIEIDAASNRRIDEIRDLRDKVRLAPAVAPYKVYIIDEVHMLTKEAFNALLKTLEEPPEHVIFILATTEAHKLPETIISRTQHYSFKAIDDSDAIKHLKQLAKSEKITVDDDALKLIAQYSNGSFRDSISLLDQLRSAEQTIDEAVVRKSIGMPEQESVGMLWRSVVAGEHESAFDLLERFQAEGYQASIISRQLAKLVRASLISESSELDANTKLTLLKNLIEVPSAGNPYQFLEYILMEAMIVNTNKVESNTTVRVDSPAETPKIKAEKIEHAAKTPEKSPTSEKKTAQKPDLVVDSNFSLKDALDNGLWDNVLASIRGKHNTLYGIARMADATTDENKLVLAFAFPFHQRRCSESRNQEIISGIIKETTGQSVQINCIVDKNAKKDTLQASNTKPAKPSSDTLESITNVFGGGEVLEP